MAYIEWTDSLSVNVKSIDEEHKKLVNMINRLHTTIMNRAGNSDIVNSFVFEMIDYADIHFAHEEKAMIDCQFDGYEEHKKEHEKFLNKALDLKMRIEKGGLVISLEILDFLRDWLKNHILKTDKKYTKCFNDHGLS